MKLKWILLSVGVLIAAASSALGDTPAPQNSGHLVLDSSKDVYFDQFSANQFSLQLLQNKKQFDNKDLVFGGSAQFDLQHWQGYRIETSPIGVYQQGTQVYFTQAQLDFMTNLMNDWTTIFVSAADSHIGQNGPDGNNVYLPQAFLLIGNLDKAPIYLTLGIQDIPFGDFSGSGAWNTPLTADYFNPSQAPLGSLGFYKNNWNAVITEYDDQSNYVYHTVYTLLYSNTVKKFSYGFGAGYLTHLASNSTGNAANNQNRYRVSVPFNLGNVSDLNANVGYGPVTLTGEYLKGSNTVSINRHIPKALGETISYRHSFFGKDATFSFGYSNSINLRDVPTALSGEDGVPLALSGIRNGWAVGATRNIISDRFTLGLNAERDVLYSHKQTYTYTMDLMAYL